MKHAVELGAGWAMDELADHYYTGAGVKRVLHQAFRLYTMAAAAHEPHAMTMLARMYTHGIGIESDPARAAAWLAQAAVIGETYAMVQLASHFNKGFSFHLDIPASMEWYERAHGRGEDGVAMRTLAELYATGCDGTENETLSRYWLSCVKQRGHAWAFRKLAVMYETNDGMVHDWSAAKEWYALYEAAVQHAGDSERK